MNEEALRGFGSVFDKAEKKNWGLDLLLNQARGKAEETLDESGPRRAQE